MKILLNKNQVDGFTLIELLVVVFIIGILVSLLLSNILGARQRAQDTQKKAELGQLRAALRLYYNDNQRFPSKEDFPDPGQVFGAADTDIVYMSVMPSIFEYDYYVNEDGQEYRLVTELDNLSDRDITKSQERCPELGSPMPSYNDASFVVCES